MSVSAPKRIMLVFGTRPEAIKMAPLVRRMAATPGLQPVVCVTAQHRQMLDQVLDLFGIRPDHDLDIMRSAQGLTYVTTAVLEGMAAIFAKDRPDRILVQGDTTTTFAAALAAFYAKIPVGHVEAGLRTWNIHSPWPEEMNRRLTGGIADLHFPPTANSRDNLLREGVDPARIHVTGNTGIDALLDAVGILDADPARVAALDAKLPRLDPAKRIVLVTGHRRENFDGGLERVARGVRMLADRGDLEIVYPVHLNPVVQDAAKAVLGSHPNIHLIAPLDYLPFVNLMRRAHLIVTDSGGVQEEAPSLGKPVLVTRDTTERPEAVTAGTVRLVGTSTEALVANATQLLDEAGAYQAMSFAHNPYGDGHAADRIIQVLLADTPAIITRPEVASHA
jgi:UDP-N-acetylglucosamine 2-epimerase